MKEQHSLDVSSRLEAALTYLIELGASKITVTDICNLAKVNRANVYQCHREFLRQLSAINESRSRQDVNLTDTSDVKISQSTPRDLITENKRLVLLCIEYKLRITELEEKIATLARR